MLGIIPAESVEACAKTLKATLVAIVDLSNIRRIGKLVRIGRTSTHFGNTLCRTDIVLAKRKPKRAGDPHITAPRPAHEPLEGNVDR
ncbi:hypothetical protein Micbo1qcDRAFT_66727 [Microdochium bolleyi]|uniref:Uncharacterized protein n=1 Tax=Microdochium bolleyi TaxID=196109 RepID=A0A136IJ30_9PEZI|nr:hypothetical protein Micbo1qcDRAFT_66727 [Microdochium bolleyi]